MRLDILKQNPDRCARFLCVAGFVLWASLLTVKFVNFGYYDWDLALYSQAMWRMVHGSLAASLFGMNFLGNHAEYISFLAAPLYFFFPQPLTLVFLNTAAFFISAYILYQVFKKFLPPWTAVLFSFLYMIYPPNMFMLAYEFHFESLALPFIAGMFLFFIDRRFKLFMACGIVACLCKENIPLIMVMFGLVSFFRKGVDKRVWGLIPLVFGLAYFFLAMFVIMPYIRRDMQVVHSIYWGLFSGLGATPQEIITSLLTNPRLLVKLLASSQNMDFLRDVLAPLNFLSLAAPWPLFISGPLFLQSMFSCMPTQHTIFFHYTATLAPSVFVAAAMGAASLKKFFRPRSFGILLCLVVTASLLGILAYARPLADRLSLVRTPKDDVRAMMVNSVPFDAPVVASFDLLSHLSVRKGLYAFYNVWLGRNLFTQSVFRLPASVRYAIVDLSDPWLRDAYLNDPEGVHERVQFFLKDGWKVLRQSQGLLLLHR